jgi:hypothetical protein
MQSQSYNLTGVSPLLLHNGQAIDPLNQYAREMKRISKKKTKTDDDHKTMSRVEWFMSIYHNGGADIVKDGEVAVDEGAEIVVPALSVEAMLIAGAKKCKLGNQAKAGLIVEDDAPLVYDGPKNINKLWDGQKHLHRVAARVGTARVMRTRPMFRSWSVTITVSYDPAVLDESQVFDILNAAGQQVGLGDWRPRFGRFGVTRAA